MGNLIIDGRSGIIIGLIHPTTHHITSVTPPANLYFETPQPAIQPILVWPQIYQSILLRFVAFGIYSNKPELLGLEPDLVYELQRFCSFFVTV